MTFLMRSGLKKVLPGRLRRWLRRRFGWRWLRGDYPDWASAEAAAGSAGDGFAVERVVRAARAVKSGQAAWDRDGVMFSDPAAHAPLLAALEKISEEAGGRLDLVDFGGGLGSTWHQHRPWLRAARTVRWRVVELPSLVAAGRREFSDDVVTFHSTLDEARAAGEPFVILFSSVLQYLPNPYALLAAQVQAGWAHIIIDRVGLNAGGRDRLAVQHTPPRLGGSRVPCWIFDQQRLLAPLAGDYELAAAWPVDFDPADDTVSYHGFHFRRRTMNRR